MSNQIVVSFVHGYNDLDIALPEQERPALWAIDGEEKKIFSYPFPRNPTDFKKYSQLMLGEMPYANSPEFKKLPRFGFTGLSQWDEYIYAGSWNSIYKIRKNDFGLEAIISNHLISDPHGICIDGDTIYTILTGKDTIVLTDHNGNIKDHFSVEKDLSISKYNDLDSVDWRFISKQFRGSTGFWHFNYIQKIGNELWLTSRNANAFVVVDLISKNVTLRLMNLCTPVLLHDGRHINGKYYFTSIDGKIIIAMPHETSDIVSREAIDDIHLYNRDLEASLIRLSETSLGKEPNWCRGIDKIGSTILVTIDGRYDSDLSFGLLAIDEDTQKIIFNHRLKWKDLDKEIDLRYVTGFDVMAVVDG